jgi:hypothetical protein
MSYIAKFALLTVAMLGIATGAQAAPIPFTAYLSGPAEFPANASPGTGSTLVTYDPASQLLTIDVTFSGLTGPTTVAHIHCCTAISGLSDPSAAGNVGVAVQPGTLTGFPVGVLDGSYFTTIDLTDATNYTANFLNNFGGGTAAGAEAALFAGMQAGTAYLNIHTTAFPGGEIRGFLATVPEPSTLSVFGIAFAGLAFGRRKKAAA